METRRLSTILFIDIAGYTDLMQSDEEKALAFLQTFKNILERIVPQYDGSIVQFFGDGCLLSFNSASQGVRSSMILQNSFQKEAIPVRVGMHLGEVVFRENNAFGDGVNIASRIESMGVPGAILLSKTVRDQIKNKSEFDLTSLGTFEFKNVHDPLEVYAITNQGFTIPDREKLQGKFKDSPEKKRPHWVIPTTVAVLLLLAVLIIFNPLAPKSSMSVDPSASTTKQKGIAVMPFQNLSPDNSDEYYCNGIMQNVLDNLSRISEFIVLPSRTTNLYKDTQLLPTELGEELGVEYLIDGTFQKIDSLIQVTVALTRTEDGRQIWTNEEVTFSLPELFSMQAKIAKQVAIQLKTGLSSELNKKMETIPTSDEIAYEYYLRATDKLKDYNTKTRTNTENTRILNEAKLLFNLALERDSSFAPVYLGLARIEFNEKYYANFLKDPGMLHFEELVNDALDLDPELSDGYFLRGIYELGELDLPDKAEANFHKSLEINPNNLEAHIALADLYMNEKLDIIESIRLLKGIEYRTVNEKELAKIYLKLHQVYSKLMDLEMEWYYLEKFNNLNVSASEMDMEWWADLALPWFYGRMGQSDKALEELRKRFPDKDNQYQLVLHGLYLAGNGQYEEAVGYYEQWEKLLDIQSEDNWFSTNDWHRYGQALVKIGRDSLGEALMRRQLSIFRQRLAMNRDASIYDMAGIYAFMGKRDSAFYYLNQVFKDDGMFRGWGNGSFILVDQQFDNIRTDPKFIELFERYKSKCREIREKIPSVDPDYLKVH